jgi:hypothetical protein
MMKLFLLCTLALSLSACGTQFSGNYTGTWSGSQGGTSFQDTTLNMTLYETGSNINGYFLLTGQSGVVSGQVTGSVSGSNLSATFTIPTGASNAIPGVGTYTGTLALNSSNLTGQLVGTSSGVQVTSTVNANQSR